MYLVEELMPADYYTNMLSLRADILIVTHLLALRDKPLMDHFESISMDISLLMVESFLTLFTSTCHPTITDVIIDHFVIDGSRVLMKAMVLIISYLRSKLLTINNFGKMVAFCKAELKKPDLVDAVTFSRDLMNTYMSKYLINELRDFYTAKEKDDFRTVQNKTKVQCDANWPICYQSLDVIKANVDIERQLSFRSHFVMENFKFDYFSSKMLNDKKNRGNRDNEHALPDGLKNCIGEDHLLIERQRHICGCSSSELENMKTEIRDLIKFQIKNSDDFKRAQNEFVAPKSPQVSDIIRKHKGQIVEQIAEDNSSYSETPENSRNSIGYSNATKRIFREIREEPSYSKYAEFDEGLRYPRRPISHLKRNLVFPNRTLPS